MSKRLRASMRAANKGRNLRPRSSQLPSAPPEPIDQAGSDAGLQVTSNDANDDPPEPSSDMRARETVREPAIPVAEESATPPAPPPPEPLPPAVGAAPEQSVLAEDTLPGSPEPVPLTKLKVTPSVEPQVVAPSSPTPPAQSVVAEPVAAAQAPSPALVTEEAQPKPVVAEPVTVAQAPSPAPVTEDAQPKRAVKVEERKKAAPAKSGVKAEREPGSRRPASLRAVPGLDDDMDASSISDAFFRRDEDSVPPIEEHEEPEVLPAPVLSPSTLERRARLRRLVAGVVAFASVISIAVVGKQVSASKRPVPLPPPVAVAVAETKHDAPAAQPATEPQKVAATQPAKADVDLKLADKADDKKAGEPNHGEEPAKGAGDAKPDDVKDAKKDEAKAAPSGADAEALKKETLSLLNHGRTKDAIAKAREAIEADATDATSYLYLGSALQDSGKWKDGIEAYCDCVRNATKGPINECRAMGGHK